MPVVPNFATPLFADAEGFYGGVEGTNPRAKSSNTTTLQHEMRTFFDVNLARNLSKGAVRGYGELFCWRLKTSS